MDYIFEEIKKTGIIPVVVIDNASDAEPLAEALIKGGLSCAEITFRTEAAEESIKIISTKFPQMLIGAGTVLSCEQADKAIQAGAKFLVSPGLNPKVASHCAAKKYPFCPGVMTPSELELALDFGFDVVKYFPAEANGGLKMIKAISAPYPMVNFLPTGGINPENLREYLSFDKVIACGGSWMVNKELISSGKFYEIESLAAAAVKLVADIRS